MSSEEVIAEETLNENSAKEAMEPTKNEKHIEEALSSRTGFTSENFKIELQGLPKFFGIGQAKKMFAKNKLNFHKLKPAGRNAPYMFVNFQNEEDRDKAIAVLDGFKIKGRDLQGNKFDH